MFEGLEGVKVVAGRCRRKLWRPLARHSCIPSNVVEKKRPPVALNRPMPAWRFLRLLLFDRLLKETPPIPSAEPNLILL